MGDREPAAKRARTEVQSGSAAYPAVDANEVINFHILNPAKEPEEIVEDAVFPPDMCHQFFGEEEEIKGYENLRIDIWVSQHSYESLLEVKYDSKLPRADDIVAAISSQFAAGMARLREEFEAKMRSATVNIDSLGEPLIQAPLADGSSLAVYSTNLSKAHQSIKDLHARMQPLLLFFVDAASLISADDPDWDLLLAVQSTGDHLAFVGFCTVYNFYCYPDRTRLRVSQVMVLPPHQGQGIGSSLLQAVYALADARNALDITFEDPTDAVQSLRERIELQRALKLRWLLDLAVKGARAPHTPPAANDAATSHQANGSPSDPFQVQSQHLLSAKDEARAQAELCVSKQQVRKLWEVLLFSRGEWPSMERRDSVVKGLIRARLVGNLTSTKRVAEGKRIFDFGQAGFMMTKVPMSSRVGAEAGMPIALESEDAEGQSAQTRENALHAAVDVRFEEILKLDIFVSGLQS